MKHITVASWLVVLLTSCATTNQPETRTKSFQPDTCDVGIYGNSDEFVVITRRRDQYSYSFADGRAGPMSDQDSLVCGHNAVQLNGSRTLAARALEVTHTQFEVNGATLAGQLIEPADYHRNAALVVYAHGSEELGWIDAVRDPYHMVARGVAVFVYDKRGTGQSTGRYSQNFPQLADDLVAASKEAKRLAGGRYRRFGLFGLSQGGWIAPLAATRAGADFIGIGYGLVVDILEEDASQVELELTEAGFGKDVLSKAKGLTDVTARLAVSGYTDGLEDLDTLRDRYRHESWYSTVQGGFSGVILGMSTEQLSTEGIPFFDRMNIDWSLDPVDVIRDVKVPQLWILAADDREAPYAKTRDRLQSLRRQGKNISISIFPNTDHGMWEFEQDTDGNRRQTRVTSGFYDMMADWAKTGKLQGAYGRSFQR